MTVLQLPEGSVVARVVSADSRNGYAYELIHERPTGESWAGQIIFASSPSRSALRDMARGWLRHRIKQGGEAA